MQLSYWRRIPETRGVGESVGNSRVVVRALGGIGSWNRGLNGSWLLFSLRGRGGCWRVSWRGPEQAAARCDDRSGQLFEGWLIEGIRRPTVRRWKGNKNPFSFCGWDATGGMARTRRFIVLIDRLQTLAIMGPGVHADHRGYLVCFVLRDSRQAVRRDDTASSPKPFLTLAQPPRLFQQLCL